MESEASIANRVTRTAKDPWSCVVGRRPEGYLIPEVGFTLVESVDRALFARDYEGALTASLVLKRWSQRLHGFSPLANSVLGGVFTVCGLTSQAEQKLQTAKLELSASRALPYCSAEYYRRRGILLFYQKKNKESLWHFCRAFDEFSKQSESVGAAKSAILRGAASWRLHEYEKALADQEYGIGMLEDISESDYIIIQALVNIISIKVSMGSIDDAVSRIESMQDRLKGEAGEGIERTRLILRWLRALILELKGELKCAGQILDRVAARFRKHDMIAELRVLLADRARMATSESLVKRIARKALELETSSEVRNAIERVLETPSAQNVQKWRDSQDSYIPVLRSVA